MDRLALALVCALVAFAGMVPAAQAQDQIAPPGNAGIDEYLETVPGGDGNRPLDRGVDDGLSPAARRRLERLGEDGRAAADLAAAGPRSASRSRGNSAEGGNGNGGDAVEEAGRRDRANGGLGSAVAAPLTGDGGMGALFPALLAATLLGGVALLVARRRRPSD